jgi:CheY-like chemotaxis protein
VRLENKLAYVVEGDAHSLTVISTLLRDLGVNFKRNMTGVHVLEQLHAMQPPPDFILLNMELPYADGCTIGHMVLRDRQLGRIPIIILGTKNADDMIAQVQQVGFAGYLAKPLPKKLFGDIIERVLAGEQVWQFAV